ncbi:MAG TPA: glutamate dehydrogenase, partial [Thiotrichaceae bacterium]|nr:glutamate dehydrogenase [Thiotrichaceae bacterium]
DLAFPCATQNEIDQKDAEILAKNGCIALAEGANMPSTREAIAVYHQEGILYAPGKAANAGGVAVSGLEMSQNSLRLSWTSEEVDEKLKEIMQRIHSQCVAYSDNKKTVDYVQGANIAGFVKVAEAMLAYGIN